MKHSRGVYRKRNVRRYQLNRSNSNKNGLLKYKNLIAGFAILILLFLGFKSFFSGESAELISASVSAKTGSTEFSIDGADQWTFLQNSVDLFAGDSLKTLGNGNASISLLGGNTIFIKENSEIKIIQLEKSKNEKRATIEIVSGEIWGHIGELASPSNDSFIKIITPRQVSNLSEGVFAISADDAVDEILSLKGVVSSNIKQVTDTITIPVSNGEKLSIDDNNKELISAEETSEYISDIPKEFIQSDWHIKNLATFFPSEALSIQEQLNQETSLIETPVIENSAIATPTIIAPEKNLTVPAETNSIQIQGTAPEHTYQISINGYTLTKYQPGDQKWSYFASTKFGTMVPGKNVYSVVATTRDGQVSAPAVIEINYAGSAVSAGATSVVSPTVVNELSKPVITAPSGLSSTAPWETSSSIVTIKGTVPPETNKVTVNEFALRQFRIGSGQFSYIANAQYGNFVKGDNLYVVKAFGPDGKTSETSVKIIYTPISL